ncbi:MAG: MATE family efflux transporter [Bacteroidales bacterium]|nr:MATE family efflux transporter [Candidatus Physcousia equi]
MRTKNDMLRMLRDGEQMTQREKLRLVSLLSVPAMLGQLSTIVMQYIDAMMVGHLGASASASIGLVSTTTWLFSGLAASFGAGFSVLVAQRIGAKRNMEACHIIHRAVVFCLIFAAVVALVCVSIHHVLPVWLGGQGNVVTQARSYFLTWALALPLMLLFHLACSMLRASGNMATPMVINILMCVLDVGLNSLFIPLWGVMGAALATASAGAICAAIALVYLVRLKHALGRVPSAPPSDTHRVAKKSNGIVRQALHIGFPMAVEHVVFCLAQIVCTIIVAPLGTVAVAANAIGITVESLCYMPGYGIGEAATTLIGQSIGAHRSDLVRSFSIHTMAVGMVAMTLLGIVMYVFAPELMQFMSIDADVQRVGTEALRIEAYAEPMYAASIVAYGIFVGAGDTIVPCVINLSTIWLVRIPLAWWLASTMGLKGVWLAMCIELCVRGTIFIIRLKMNERKPQKQNIPNHSTTLPET